MRFKNVFMFRLLQGTVLKWGNGFNILCRIDKHVQEFKEKGHYNYYYYQFNYRVNIVQIHLKYYLSIESLQYQNIV